MMAEGDDRESMLKLHYDIKLRQMENLEKKKSK